MKKLTIWIFFYKFARFFIQNKSIMILDINMLRQFYANYSSRVDTARKALGHPLTYAEKVLYAHLYQPEEIKSFQRGAAYVDFAPDRVAMQDATAQMALLQFMNAGKDRVAVPASVHCDHLVRADIGAEQDQIGRASCRERV